jgi:hypothetical protein
MPLVAFGISMLVSSDLANWLPELGRELVQKATGSMLFCQDAVHTGSFGDPQ